MDKINKGNLHFSMSHNLSKISSCLKLLTSNFSLLSGCRGINVLSSSWIESLSSHSFLMTSLITVSSSFCLSGSVKISKYLYKWHNSCHTDRISEFSWPTINCCIWKFDWLCKSLIITFVCNYHFYAFWFCHDVVVFCCYLECDWTTDFCVKVIYSLQIIAVHKIFLTN